MMMDWIQYKIIQKTKKRKVKKAQTKKQNIKKEIRTNI